MEIIDAKAANLTNYEVLKFLKEQKATIGSKKGKSKANKSLLTVTLETINWLVGTAAGLQEESHVKELAIHLGQFCKEQGISLTKQELIHVINQRPESAVEIQLLIENSEARLTDEQVDKVIEIVATHLPANSPEEEEEEEQDEEALTEDVVDEGAGS